jgi:hypothetical protein
LSFAVYKLIGCLRYLLIILGSFFFLMPKSLKNRKIPEGKIEKPEDKVWLDWYNKLDAKEHEEKLSQLGLDQDDIQEWEEVEGFKKPEKKKK